MEDNKKIIVETCVLNTKMNQNPNEQLGITQEYNAENRAKLWDSAKKKKEYKEKKFEDKAIYDDAVSGKTLHKSQKAAQAKYHMKNDDGKNISKKWAEHSAETDHINAIKDVHNVAKHNPFLNDEDFNQILNYDENYRLLSKHFNTIKGEKNDWEIILDKDNGLTFDARKQLAQEKIRADVFLQKEFAKKTAINMGKEFVSGAEDALVNAAIPLTSEVVSKIVQVAQGKISTEEAVHDLGKISIDVAVAGGTNQLLVDAMTQCMLESNNEIFVNLAKNGEIGKILVVASIVKESAVRYINGDIDEKEFFDEVGDKGTNLIAAMIGGQLGKEIGQIIGLGVGMTVGPAGMVAGYYVGEIVGQVLGTIITTIACSGIISVFKLSKNLDSYKLKEHQIKKLETDALAEMARQRDIFKNIVHLENERLEKEVQEGFDMMLSNACKETYCLEGVTEGLDKVLAIFGKKVAFTSLDEYEKQINQTLKLSF